MAIYSVGRRRVILALLLTSALLLTLDLRGNPFVDRGRDVMSRVMDPVESAVGVVTNPLERAWNGVVNFDDVERENQALQDRARPADRHSGCGRSRRAAGAGDPGAQQPAGVGRNRDRAGPGDRWSGQQHRPGDRDQQGPLERDRRRHAGRESGRSDRQGHERHGQHLSRHVDHRHPLRRRGDRDRGGRRRDDRPRPRPRRATQR